MVAFKGQHGYIASPPANICIKLLSLPHNTLHQCPGFLLGFSVSTWCFLTNRIRVLCTKLDTSTSPTSPPFCYIEIFHCHTLSKERCFFLTVHFSVALPPNLNLLVGVHSIYKCLDSIYLKWPTQVRETKYIGQFSIDNPFESFVPHYDNRSIKRHPAILQIHILFLT